MSLIFSFQRSSSALTFHALLATFVEEPGPGQVWDRAIVVGMSCNGAQGMVWETSC